MAISGCVEDVGVGVSNAGDGVGGAGSVDGDGGVGGVGGVVVAIELLSFVHALCVSGCVINLIL